MMWLAILAILMVVASYVFVVALAAACVYLPYLLVSSTELSTQSVLLFVFGIAIAGGLLWSLLPRPDKFTAPGPLLDRTQHPRLFEELDAIAASLNEPMPSEVYLIGEVNAWVADRGGVMGLGGRRVMGLGLPLMSILTVSQFRGVVAHEFAHYYGGDTSLGPWVYKTKMAMMRTFQTVGSLRNLARFWVLVIMYVVVTTILKWYFIVFLRAINLVSRKQEYRADELACLVAGRQSLIDGLRTIHGAGRAWQPYWTHEVVPVLQNGSRPALGDGFACFVAAPRVAEQIARDLGKEILEGKGSPYDTHPPLRDRIAAAEGLPPASLPEDTRLASSLLEDRAAAELGFLKVLNPNLQLEKFRYVAWDEVAAEVTVPSWKKAAAEQSGAFTGYTVGTVSDAIGKLPQIGAGMRDPKGTLLSPEQRTARAGQLLAVALALALLANGWELHSQPGVFHFQRGNEQLDPFVIVQQLMEGKLSREAWATRSRELDIAQLPLFSEGGAAR